MVEELGEARTRQPEGKRDMRSRNTKSLSGREGWIVFVTERMPFMSAGVIWRHVGGEVEVDVGVDILASVDG